MALTEVENLYNLALGYIGEYEIEDSAASRALKQYTFCDRYYASARDEILAAHPWNEAMTRTILLQASPDPLFGYDRKYTKPTDCLRVFSVDDSIGSDYRNEAQGIYEWEVEGDYILSNAGQVPQSWESDTDYIDGEFVSITPAEWATGTAYYDGEYKKYGTLIYEVLSDHTSSTVAADVTSGYIISRGEGSTVSYEVLVTHTSDSTGSTTAAQQYVDILAGNISASGDKVDAREVFVTYIKQLTDTTDFSPKLKQAVALNLAIKIITGLTNDTSGKINLINELTRLVMPEARSIDAQQGKPRPIFNSEWIRARR
jgi:hypothetical protein